MTNSRPAPKRRGKGFPVMALDEAGSVVKSAGKYGRDHKVGAFAGYLGHKTTNSGAFLAKMAALNDWGLIERDGDRVSLSELGHHIAHPVSADDERGMLRKAFFHAEPFAAIYEDSAKNTELSLELIGNRAVTERGVAAQSKRRFAQSFVRSVVAAELGEGSNGSIRLLPPRNTDESVDESPANEESASGASARRDEHAMAAPTDESRQPHRFPPTMHQEWEIEDGLVIFEARLGKPLPAGAFSELADVVTAVENLVASLDPPGDSGDEDAAG